MEPSFQEISLTKDVNTKKHDDDGLSCVTLKVGLGTRIFYMRKKKQKKKQQEETHGALSMSRSSLHCLL